MEKQYYNRDETAKILGVHVNTVTRYLLEGKLKGIKIGKSWRINPEDVQAFFKAEEERTNRAIEAWRKQKDL